MGNESSACHRSARERHLSGGGIGEAEADVELLHLMPAAATTNRNAALTVEGIKLEVLAAEPTGRQLDLDEVRELPLIHVPGDFALAAAHARSSDRREWWVLNAPLTMPGAPLAEAAQIPHLVETNRALERESMLTVRITCFPTAYVDVNFAPHPHPHGLADQSGQIPARVLQPSHNTQKNRATRLLTATDATGPLRFGGLSAAQRSRLGLDRRPSGGRGPHYARH